ncbi:MAG TPA: nitroreductase/quinone reductase family protein [Ktedonobacterales bacterium]|jgi:deazaflavin-dependent oxidoreductase (nitroreductase family)|nr:nitroreductase/quinone reductase family protein [Ktedonobacterales bacterium]
MSSPTTASARRRAPAPWRWLLALQVALYRRSGGRLVGRVGRTPVLLLTTTGRRTGTQHTVPLGYFDDGGVRYVVASNGGAPRNPAWYFNLVAHPEVRVQVGAEVSAAVARPAAGEERARLWEHLMTTAPMYRRYARAPREIPLVVLTPKG